MKGFAELEMDDRVHHLSVIEHNLNRPGEADNDRGDDHTLHAFDEGLRRVVD